MPRPKRTKVAPSATTRVDTRPNPTIASDNAIERRNAHPSSDRRAEPHEDDNTGSATAEKTISKAPQPPAQRGSRPSTSGASNMTAARTAGRVVVRPRTVARKVVQNEGQSKALEALKKRREAAMRAKSGRSAQSPSVVQTTPVARIVPQGTTTRVTNTSSAGQRSVQRGSTIGSVRPSAVVRARPRTPSVERESGSPDLYGLSPTGKASQAQNKARREYDQQQPQSALKAQGTPAVETSVLALANFRRRPRQHSILRMVQQTNDNGNDDFDDIDDFNPDDESTPFNFNKNKPHASTPKESNGATPEQAQTSSSRKRKLSPPEVQVPRSSPPLAEQGDDTRESSEPFSDAPSLPEGEVTEEASQNGHRDATPEIWSETMAPPKSSSSLEDYQEDGDVHTAIRASKTPAKRNTRSARLRNRDEEADGDASAGEEETTPARTKKPTSNKPPRAPPMSTAALQSLLPQRRNQTRPAQQDQYDIPSSSDIDATMLDTDEDELQRPAGRRATASRKTTSRTPNRKSTAIATTARKNRGRSRTTTTTTSPLSARKSKPTPTNPGRKTYAGRRASSEKENDHDTIHVGGARSDVSEAAGSADEEEELPTRRRGRGGVEGGYRSAELAAAARKFREVDEWEMEFESADAVGGESSPWR